ncbi:MAG: hypothetical protein ABIJ43_04820 [Candidatus Beckwithbacteria bacterium]
MKNNTSKQPFTGKSISGLFKTIALMILLVPTVAYAGSIFEEQKANQEKQKIDTLSTKSVVSSPPISQPKNEVQQDSQVKTIDCVGPDGKQFKTSETECKKLNEAWGKQADYMINCNISSNCGGGTTYIKKSECDNSVCCQIGDKWVFYKDKNQCNKDQESNQPSYNYPTYTYPTTNNNPSNQAVDNSAYNRDQQSICMGDARSNYQTQETQLRQYYRAKGALGSSGYDVAQANLYNDLLRAIASCKSQYPY